MARFYYGKTHTYVCDEECEISAVCTVYAHDPSFLILPFTGVKPLYDICLDYISQTNTEKPDNADMASDVLSRYVQFISSLFITWLIIY